VRLSEDASETGGPDLETLARAMPKPHAEASHEHPVYSSWV